MWANCFLPPDGTFYPWRNLTGFGWALKGKTVQQRLEFLRSAGLKGVFGDMVIQTFLAFLNKELILIEKTWKNQLRCMFSWGFEICDYFWCVFFFAFLKCMFLSFLQNVYYALFPFPGCQSFFEHYSVCFCVFFLVDLDTQLQPRFCYTINMSFPACCDRSPRCGRLDFCSRQVLFLIQTPLLEQDPVFRQPWWSHLPLLSGFRGLEPVAAWVVQACMYVWVVHWVGVQMHTIMWTKGKSVQDDCRMKLIFSSPLVSHGCDVTI